MENILILFQSEKYDNLVKYACAEGGAHLLIAHALRLLEPTIKPKAEGCVPLLRFGTLAVLSWWICWGGPIFFLF